MAAAASAVVMRKSTGNAWASVPNCVAEIAGAASRCSKAKTPTDANATSFTIDSNAMASITPSWCSVASSRRVPNRMANTAIISATQSAVSAYHAGFAPIEPVSTSMLVPTALYCSARYGTPAVRAITATSAARVGLLPKRDEIRSAIDVMLWARTSRDQPLEERHAEEQHQGRPQVDRNVCPAVAHGGAHCAEERPRRAVDAEGQAVDPRPQARVTRVHGMTLAVERDAEQHQQVADGERGEQEARDHRATLGSARPPRQGKLPAGARVRDAGVPERRRWCAGCIRRSRAAACRCPARAGSRRRLAAATRS